MHITGVVNSKSRESLGRNVREYLTSACDLWHERVGGSENSSISHVFPKQHPGWNGSSFRRLLDSVVRNGFDNTVQKFVFRALLQLWASLLVSFIRPYFFVMDVSCHSLVYFLYYWQTPGHGTTSTNRNTRYTIHGSSRRTAQWQQRSWGQSSSTEGTEENFTAFTCICSC